MNELIEFLTSKEIIIVYCISFLACLLCFIIYIVEKHSDNYKKKHNTRELNKLVAQIKDKFVGEEAETIEALDEPILEIDEENSSVDDMLESTLQLDSIAELEDEVVDESYDEPLIIEPIDIVEDIEEEPEAELEYTTIEPDQETAQLELKRLTEELRKSAEIEVTGELSLSNFEEQQEENAIISLEELLKRGKDIYKANEATQYIDERTMPISLQELEIQSGSVAASYDEPFLIENAISQEEKKEVEQEVLKEKPKLHLDDFNTIGTKFKSSPIISPVFGIEKPVTNELELENTANYEKFDQEISKSQDFMMTLQELQDK
ncbi:MAG: hypothetical protein IJI58_02340 [Bacilli bacterium]|nr:hypothetical protein [Bacilli bacterium]